MPKTNSFHTFLFAGPPGTGKTTAAMALTKDVFGDNYKENLLEMNASDERKLRKHQNQGKTIRSNQSLWWCSIQDYLS